MINTNSTNTQDTAESVCCVTLARGPSSLQQRSKAKARPRASVQGEDTAKAGTPPTPPLPPSPAVRPPEAPSRVLTAAPEKPKTSMWRQQPQPVPGVPQLVTQSSLSQTSLGPRAVHSHHKRLPRSLLLCLSLLKAGRSPSK